MSLETEIAKARKEIVADGYEMSFGEVMNLYRDEELVISPSFQRLFRWDAGRKSRFIESLLLGIPIPPIFVFQNPDGEWELIDGLQRISTVFEFAGLLRLADGSIASPSVLEGTKFLPSLEGMLWELAPKDKGKEIGKALQIQIKRARLRVEILKPESDPTAKYELFQRLNTGGVGLSEQEVRNCVAVMLNKSLYDWMVVASTHPSFVSTTEQTTEALKQQAAVELVLRFIAFRNVKYNSSLDVHPYLDDALLMLATGKVKGFRQTNEERIFKRTFDLLDLALGKKTFKRWDGDDFKGKFLMSLFEVIATGVSLNIDALEKLTDAKAKSFILQQAKKLWSNPVFIKNSGAGIRGTTRLANLLPMAASWFKP